MPSISGFQLKLRSSMGIQSGSPWAVETIWNMNNLPFYRQCLPLMVQTAIYNLMIALYDFKFKGCHPINFIEPNDRTFSKVWLDRLLEGHDMPFNSDLPLMVHRTTCLMTPMSRPENALAPWPLLTTWMWFQTTETQIWWPSFMNIQICCHLWCRCHHAQDLRKKKLLILLHGHF